MARALATASVLTFALFGGHLIQPSDSSMLRGNESALAVSQDGTPAASPATVDPSDCRVAPRPIEDFSAVLGTSGVGVSALEGTPKAMPVLGSDGAPADPAIVEGVTATVRELLACANAGDFRRAAALYTDEFFRRFFGGLDEQDLASLVATPTPLPPELRAPVVAVTDVRVLDDGRVGATVGKSYLVFVESGGRYLLDDSIALPGAGSPTP